MRQFLVFAIIVLLFLMLLGAFGFLGTQVNPTVGTMVAHTQTATMWTPAPVTPSATPVPNQAFILKTLNSALQQEADSLEETLDAKFSILDIGFGQSENPPITTSMEVHVECEWVSRYSCTEERAFTAFANAFKGVFNPKIVKPDVRKKMMAQIPKTIRVVQIRAFDHMNQIGMIEISWECLLAFANGNITGEQLASRILRFTPPP